MHRPRPGVRALLLSTAFVALTGCAGGGTGGQTSAAPSPPAPSAAGQELVADVLVDGEGRTQHLVCLGPTDTGEPTILLEAGLMSPYQTWSEVLTAMSAEHRLCAYDRAGLGASPSAGEDARTAEDILTDLHAMLSAANVNGPFVLVGHSLGAFPIALYAATYPTEVVGVVLVDPRGPRVSAEWAAALPPATDGEPAAITANREELATFETDPSLNAEHLDLAASSAEVIAVLDEDGPLFASRPVVVLQADGTPDGWADLPAELAAAFDAAWIAGQQEFADESTSGHLVTVPDSGHEIQVEQPAAVISAIEDMLAAVVGS